MIHRDTHRRPQWIRKAVGVFPKTWADALDNVEKNQQFRKLKE